jgi:3-hydroxyisobutyrate dehydrogenase-like beta-hydroxyacid dehydrogenase
MSSIAVLHPGEMGAAIGRALADTGHDVCWLPHGRGAGTRRRAHAAGLVERDDVAGCDVVLSVCPPSAAVANARSVAGFTGLYVDANAISPDSAAEVAATVAGFGASYVDGGVIGPPPVQGGTTRIYLSGDRADEVATVFAGARIEARLLDAGPFAASGLKMTYAAWTKISAALLVAARGAAHSLGVEPDLVEEWTLSQPGLEDRSRHSLQAAQAKGWRWEAEMQEIARTFAAAGQPAGFGQAAAELFGRYPRPADT